jgi:hypothetical protein
MRVLTRSMLMILTGCAVAASTGAHAAPPAAATTRPAGRPGVSPVLAAQQALLKEYLSVMKDKKGEGLREKCDYFTTNPAEGVTPELILAALEKPVGGGDARADAYVKWQLLSGVAGKFPESLKVRAIRAYRAAPSPAPHPGLNHMLLDRKLNAVGTMRSDAEGPINKEIGDVITVYRVQIEPMLAYRDELLARLPPGFDTFVAGLGDAYDRVIHGAPANEFWSSLSASIKSWALTSAEPAQMRQIAGAIEKLKDTVKDEKFRPYYRVLWTDNASYKGLKWQAEGTIVNDKALDDLAEFLAEQARNPGGGGLQFKDAPDPKGKK